MSKLMWIVGILLIAAGIALGVLLAVSPASVVPFGHRQRHRRRCCW